MTVFLKLDLLNDPPQYYWYVLMGPDESYGVYLNLSTEKF